jgi:hypothetical protein
MLHAGHQARRVHEAVATRRTCFIRVRRGWARLRDLEHHGEGDEPGPSGQQPRRHEAEPLDRELAEQRPGADTDVERQ